ncbi:TadE/TadG family type IV pilus assembly protein [Roseovarius dicentrarchi]|uniref:TadE/TadG family type IV pilus assembly protein n=1 Tax=Roseovarius dicentrarchi TaxID=2250573 RepID=UPI000DEB22E3|nr:pilus assembly protein [Roseovarius dicentrarchi]
MFRCILKSWLARFNNDERGTVMVEAVITLPLLIWAIGATYEFFELHRYNSARDKASYTIADMISREGAAITPTYIDNAKIVFDTISNDGGANSLRISVVKFVSSDNEYVVQWSKVRGAGDLPELETSDIKTAHDKLPVLRGGEELIIVESVSTYPAIFKVGLSDDLKIRTTVMTSPRFVPQVKWEDS